MPRKPGRPSTRKTLPNTGAMLLVRWLEEYRYTQAELADEAHTTAPRLSRILSGKAKVSLEEAIAIDKITKGAVPMTAWVVPIHARR